MILLITGTAGFIGHYVARQLLQNGHTVVGVDSINDYYSVSLKLARLQRDGIDSTQALVYGKEVQSTVFPQYTFVRMRLEDRKEMASLFERYHFDKVCNLAAQAGVRYSLENPESYIDSNISGFLSILEGCRKHGIKHLVYASSSSVYGLNTKMPFAEDDRTDCPTSLYAATKKANEQMAFTYKQLYGLNSTGLRFFSVYGPWGRPDMATMIFSNAIMEHKPIQIFNNGDLYRDFTYVEDICRGVVTVLEAEPRGAVYNIGCCHPVHLMDLVTILEDNLGQKAIKEFLPMQKGDVYETYADCSRLQQDYAYKPGTTLKEGLEAFVKWFLSYKNY